MIDKKYLRIGNSVSYKGEVYSVLEIGGDLKCMIESKLLNRTWWILYETLDPIPITEEALVKMNIAKVNGYPYRFLDGYIKIRNGNYFFKYYNLEIPLGSIHQLQNAIYALTQTELSYEP